MNFWHSLILGIVEGLTEFLPVSSTGHLILTSEFLRIPNSDAAKAFEVVIQCGAVFAVIWHYRETFASLLSGLLKGDSKSWQLGIALFLGFLPAAVIGLAFHSAIKARLFGVEPVMLALIVGGIAMIVIERRLSRQPAKLEFLWDGPPKPLTAFKIGLFQCLALWPGTSRSMATILGARLCGLNPRRAAEFSFLLAVPTLLAASGLEIFRHGHAMAQELGLMPIVVGLSSSFFVSLLVIRALLEFLKNYSLQIFGWYRIAAGILLWIFVL